MLKAEDLPGVSEDVALAIISYAVSIAPCLDRLPEEGAEGDAAVYRGRALGVLRLVAKGAAKRGDALIRGQRVGSAGVDYGQVGTWFSSDTEAALRGICSALCGGGLPGLPVGEFPRHGLVSGVWPEERV